ncbi:SRPBCC domain-containing protein [Myxococcus sp. CA040A]|uniref:SRPBCC family protein n=1 Tax=Myxococcus sp. CA040A TaxID=2741738 RepID=UPI00157B1668|nr:SRPBCC domain-containing protein [Myxococcus sp. CA040A]NTX00160.1 SRPBCC domain-containing protein [Myxococcus sp. CA040A]
MSPSFEHEFTFKLPAPPERVYRALTDPAELRHWFAEHAEVEPRVFGAYRFWGKATLGAPREPGRDQVLTALEPGRELRFSWTIQGVPTEVNYTLQSGEGPDACSLVIRHAVRGQLPFRQPRHVIDDLWRIHTGNLKDHLREGIQLTLPDFSGNAPEVRASIEIAAPPAKVYRALLVPELMNRWLFGAARVDAERGEISYGWNYTCEGRSVAGGPTRILEKVENERLVTDWTDWRGEPDKPMTRVTWLLEPLAEGRHTRVTVIHDRFELPVDRSDYQQGWAGFLRHLGKVATDAS